jgi:phosphate starvation-inducible PhoH-like protein
LPADKVSGLKEVIKILAGIDDIAICTLSPEDVVRHRLVQKIIEAYDRVKPEKAETPAKHRRVSR